MRFWSTTFGVFASATTKGRIRSPYWDVMARSTSSVAAIQSLLIPGVGQIYNGKFLRGIFWLIITPGFWIGSGGTLGWICHLISSYTAYRYAKKSTGTSQTRHGPPLEIYQQMRLKFVNCRTAVKSASLQVMTVAPIRRAVNAMRTSKCISRVL